MAKDDESSIKLDNVLPAIDRKDYDWWETLTKAQQDKFSSFLYMRYTSAVQADPDLMRYYLMSTNLNANRRFGSLKNHPKLQYLMMVASSPGMGVKRHTWLNVPKKGKGNKRSRIYAELYPNYREDELELMAKINTDEDLKAALIDAGWTDKEINTAFKNIDE